MGSTGGYTSCSLPVGQTIAFRRLPPLSLSETLAHLYFDLARLRDFLLRKCHGKHAILVLGLHVLRIHAVRQSEYALEASERTLHTMPAALLLVVGFELALAPQG